VNKLRVAAGQYDIGFFEQFADVAGKLEQWVASAADNHAALLVMPEYGSMELTSTFGEEIYSDLRQQLHAMQPHYAKWQALHLDLAKRFDVLLVGASYPLQLEDGRFYNRAVLYTPDGVAGHQDKLIMTRFEREDWIISAGRQINLIETDIGPIGINVCYDVEFPLLARQLAEQGARVIIVPSCTDTKAGFHRVRIGCQARALENQCYAIQSPTVGSATWSPAVDENTGVATVYTPVDYGFPDDGILVQGIEGGAGWVYADLDLLRIDHVRREGQVTNFHDWQSQFGIGN